MIQNTQVDRILRLPEVMHIVALGKTTIYALIKTDDFPKQIKLGKKTTGWLESEIRQWVAERAQSRSA